MNHVMSLMTTTVLMDGRLQSVPQTPQAVLWGQKYELLSLSSWQGKSQCQVSRKDLPM